MMNLGNVADARPYWPNPCNFCQALVPNRTRMGQMGRAETDYERVDYFPAFPGLTSSAQAGCLFCSIFLLLAVGDTVQTGLWESFEHENRDISSTILDWYSKRDSLDKLVRVKISFRFSMSNSLHYANTEGPTEDDFVWDNGPPFPAMISLNGLAALLGWKRVSAVMTALLVACRASNSADLPV